MAKKSEDDYIFASVLIRSKESALLKRSDFESLAEQESIEALLRVLSEYGYGEGVTEGSGMQQAREFEALLEDNMREAYESLLSLTADEPQMKLFLYQNDYRNAKVLLKAEGLNIDPMPLLTETASIQPQRMQDSFRKRDFALLSSAMKEGITEAYEAFSKSRDPQEIDIILDKACCLDMLNAAEELGNDFVLEYVKLAIDCINISAFVRLRKIAKPLAFFTRSFAEGGNIDKRVFESIYNEENTAIAPKLAPYGYGELFSVGAQALSETGSYALFECILDNLKMNCAKSVKYQPFGLETIAAYLVAKETEIKNLRIILSGKLAGTETSTLMERLRDAYV